jgi:molybdate transport repressor ModE-like protein/molybdopterin-binding protein
VNEYDVTVESCDARDSHAWLAMGKARLAARAWDGIRRGQQVKIRIRPEDVLLCEGHPGRVSARNVLPGRVTGIRHQPGGVRADLDVGFPLTAAITRAAVKELRLRRGSGVFAIVKASVVTPVVPVSAGYRVSLVGPKGVLGYEKLDFMRAIESSGSLLAASKALGITYRTAWLWAREIGRIWGTSLIVRTHGGKGGGGTQLTPEGNAVLALAAKLEKRGG